MGILDYLTQNNPFQDGLLSKLEAAYRSRLVPFDPSMHTPQPVIMEDPSTEYISTDLVNGRVMNYPEIWWENRAGGAPAHLSGDAGYNRALEYEQQTGRRFPRFGSLAEAIDMAKRRSQMGGASHGTLMDWYRPDGVGP